MEGHAFDVVFHEIVVLSIVEKDRDFFMIEVDGLKVQVEDQGAA